MKILISGGHITPALAMIDFIQEYHQKVELVFVGRVFSQDKLKQKSIEEFEVKKRKIKFISFEAVRMVHDSFFIKITKTFSFFMTLIAANKIVKKENPSVFLSFGGYLAIPFAIVCWLRKIPIITHEQTRSSGIANIFIGKLAAKVAISFPESSQYFNDKKVVLTGNPLRKGLFNNDQVKPNWLPTKITKPLLIIMGGNQGSKIINYTVAKILPLLLEDWVVVHQCGKPTSDNNYLKDLTDHKNRLVSDLQNSYFVFEWISDSDLFWLYSKIDGAITRSGANTIAELAQVNVPSIQIPLSYSYNNEQFLNAQWLIEQSGALLLEEKDLTPQLLLEKSQHLLEESVNIKNNLKEIKIGLQASQKLFGLISKVNYND